MSHSREPRMTQATLLVLRELLVDPSTERYGLDLVRAAGLATGTIHPILARLEGCGWLESRWEDRDPHEAGRPRRRYYRITPDGIVGAARMHNRATASESPRLRTRGAGELA